MFTKKINRVIVYISSFFLLFNRLVNVFIDIILSNVFIQYLVNVPFTFLSLRRVNIDVTVSVLSLLLDLSGLPGPF